MAHLTDLFRQRREASRISLGNLARLCGYSNLAKGSNRIQTFERSGKIEPTLLGKLASALGIASSEIHRAVAQDRTEWEAWASEPIEPHLIVRLVAAFYSRSSIPVEIRGDRAAMEEYSADYAATNRLRVCLVLSRRLRVWFDRDGRCSGVTEDTFGRRNGPIMAVEGRDFLIGG
jgi:hypothetical protein